MIFLDSSCYIQEKLRTFTETFDVKTVKGYFPHKFNVNENWDYVGVIPNKKYFLQEDVETSDFIAWYERQRCKGAVWDFQKKIKNILSGRCVITSSRFRKISAGS